MCNSNHVFGDNDFDFFSDWVDTPETHDAERVLLSVVTRCVCLLSVTFLLKDKDQGRAFLRLRFVSEVL